MRTTLLITLIFCGFLSNGQDTVKSTMFLSDFDFFIEKLIETHPDPYTGFGNQIEFYRAKQEIREKVVNVKNTEEFTHVLNKFLSRLEDGHSTIYDNYSKSKKLPLELKTSTDYLFIQNSTEEFKKFIGKSVLEINNIPINRLLEEVKVTLPSENISGAYYNLIKVLNNDILASKLFGEFDSLKFTFGNTEDNISTSIAYQNEVSFISKKTKIELANNNGLLYYSMLGKNKDIGYFAWNSIVSREIVEQVFRDNPKYIENNINWAYGSMHKKRTGDIQKDILQIPALYEQFFLLIKEMELKNSKYLIIDLRNNGGGMTPLLKPLLYILYGEKYLEFDFKDEMIRKLSPLYLRKIGMKSIDDFNKAYNCNFQLGDYTFSSFGNFDNNLSLAERKEIVENGYSGFGSEYIKKLMPAPRKNYEIIVLTSPKTFSAAYHFTYFLKKLGNTKIVGVASRQAGNSFMETTNFELPLTKLQGSISNSKQILFKENIEFGKLLRPDYEMNWNDFKKYDFDLNAELLKAIDLIDNGEINAR